MVRKHKKRLFNRRTRPPAEILITVDESGNLGDRTRGNCYLVVGCRVNDRDGFIHATKKYNADHEMKFSNPDDAPYRMAVLRDASPFIDDVRYVYAFKPNPEGWETKRGDVHTTLLRELKEDLEIDPSKETLIMVDQNDIIKDDDVRRIFKGKRTENKGVACVVLPSQHFYELQTNDFVAGAINQEVNKFNSAYVLMLRKPPKGRKVKIK